MSTRRQWQRGDLVPLAERLRHLQLFRLLAVLLALLRGTFGAGSGPGPVPEILAVGASAAGLGLLASLVARHEERRGRWLFGLVLLIDGLVLAWLAHLLGGLGSPARYLPVLHVVLVTLIASHRTGMKLAIWHSLLLFVQWELEQVGWLDAVVSTPSAMTAHLALMWVLTLLTALASAANEREILRRRFDLEALARMSVDLDASAGVREVAETIVTHVANTFTAPRVALVDVAGDVPSLLAGWRLGPPKHAAPGQWLEGVLGVVASTGATRLVTRFGSSDTWLGNRLPDARHCSLIPLQSDGSVREVLVIEHGHQVAGRLERRVVSTLERFATEGAMALRSARLHAELVALANTDGLTGVANRTAFDRTLAVELARAARSAGSTGLVLCDLDHFKQVNDVHGHQVGDAVLVAAARALAGCCREHDVVARYGGEEFAVVMPDVDEMGAREVAERLRAAVSHLDFPFRVTISVGAVTARGGVAPAAVLEAADHALYRAKELGRDRVVVGERVCSALTTAVPTGV